MRVKLTILLLSIIASTASWAQDAEATLKQFEGKTLILRHPLEADFQRYDAEGKALKSGGKEGSWAVFSGVLIEHVTLTPDKLRLDGRRIFFLFPKQKLPYSNSHGVKSQWSAVFTFHQRGNHSR